MCKNHQEAKYPVSERVDPPVSVPPIDKAFAHLNLNCSYEEADEVIKKAIDAVDAELREVSIDIHSHPELGLKEHRAHDLLSGYMEKKGFQVSRGAFGMDTAFSATYTNGPGRRVGVCSEYDCLPEIGHACGHNLIAICGVATALGLKALLEQGKAQGTVILYGTPAEELLYGKIKMIKENVFQEQVDCCVMAHPAPGDGQYVHLIASDHAKVEFRGKPSHAAAAPFHGVNALDAMVQAMNSVGLMRQQLLGTDRVAGIITHGGSAVNVIPDYTAGDFECRTYLYKDMKRVKDKLEACFEGAAKATGCSVKIEWSSMGASKDMIHNEVLADTYAYYMEQFGIKFAPRLLQETIATGSSDMGNVSYVVPSIHPVYNIHTTASNHTREFTAAAETEPAHQSTILAAKGLALSASKVLLDDNYYQAMKLNFEQRIAKESDAA
ncbi:hypothetical protein BC940DRAFT_350550 [Gongronella butleri]|nr:hypothetical protein BC940DRAFT_350550 [Gongronella butleri]